MTIDQYLDYVAYTFESQISSMLIQFKTDPEYLENDPDLCDIDRGSSIK